MSTILTDGERRAAIASTAYNFKAEDIARAVEAAVLAKLAQQSPDIEPDEAFELGLERVAYYTHPSPQQADRQRVPDGWVNAMQKIADENEVEPSFVTMVFDDLLPVFMADKDAAGYVTLPLASLIESDSYDVYGSDFYRCKVCGAESGAGLLNKGIQHKHNCPLAAAPEAPAQASAVDEREAFEAWWEKQTGFAPKRDDSGEGYVVSGTERQWEAWQARAALAQKGGK